MIVLSNQSGIGRGFFDERAAQRVNDRVAELLRARNIDILGWYMCPHAPEEGCDCRKPLPGMALAAARDVSVATCRLVRVAQLALPALTRIPRMRPRAARTFFRATSTGPATTRFCVNTAPAVARVSETISARSSFMTLRIPAKVAE